MRVINKSRDVVLSEQAQLTDSFWGRLRGLMMSYKKDVVLASPREDIASSTIHMWFMMYPIDVVWVDAKLVVVDVKKNVPPANPLKPRTLETHAPKKPAKYVIELAGLSAGETSEGDQITFE